MSGALTDPQKALILQSEPDGIGNEGYGVEIRGPEIRVAISLKRLGLGHYTHGGSLPAMYWNTAAGLEVYADLKGED